LAAWYDKISGILPGSEHLRAIIKDVERTGLGILTRAVNDIHLSVEHCGSITIAILSALTSKTCNRKYPAQPELDL